MITDGARPDVWRADQMRDVDPELMMRGSLYIRTSFHRSRESQQHEQPAQDYLTYGSAPRAVWWVVADGVGGSFCGDIAARVAADHVLDWLSRVSLEEFGADQLESGLRHVLAGAMEPGHQAVQSLQLPASLHPAIRDSLERQRPAGSETMIACGRIERSAVDGGRMSVFVASLGDMRTRWSDDRGGGELARSTAHRWSSRRGVVGDLACHLARDVLRLHLSAYSDGLASLDGRDEITSAELDETIAAARTAADSDDMCLFEIWDREPSQLQSALPAPAPRVVVTRDAVHASWSPVPGATHYVIELSGKEITLFQVMGRRWSQSGLPPGEYRVRVSGVDQRSGTRSEPCHFVVEAAAVRGEPVSAPTPWPSFEELMEQVVEPAYRIAFGLLERPDDAERAVLRAATRASRAHLLLRSDDGFEPWFLEIVAAECGSILWGRRWRTTWAIIRRRRSLRFRTASRGAIRPLDARGWALTVMLHHTEVSVHRIPGVLAVVTGRDEAELRTLVRTALDASRPPSELQQQVLTVVRRTLGQRAPRLEWLKAAQLAVLLLLVAALIGAVGVIAAGLLAPSNGPAAPGIPAVTAKPTPGVTTPLTSPVPSIPADRSSPEDRRR